MSANGVKHIRAVERAIDVLGCLSQADAPLGVTDLERALSLSRPTLYRLLATLEGKGMVRSFGEPRRFALDYPVVELAGRWLARNDVVPAAQPYLDRLWRATDETVAMFIAADPTTKICVQELQSRQALVFTRGIGFSEPVTVGSSGSAILAFMPPTEIESVLDGLPDDTARAAKRRELATVRANGYGATTGTIIAGAVALAAPVFDRLGRVRASVSVFGPEARLRDAHRNDCIRQLLATAADISAAIGYRGDAAAE
ncbi:MAG: IclR family transcriptional regulator [Alphaproteobacteria bacterium]